MAPPERPVRPTSTIRGALIAGFAVVFGLWLLSGYELVRSLRDVEQRVTEVHASLLRGDQVLDAVRTSVLLGSIYLRDALIDDASPTREYYRDELNQIRADVERVLPAYVPEVESPVEREHWATLQTKLEEYWASREVVFTPDAPRTTGQAAALLRSRVVPARESILEIVDALAALQRTSRERHEMEASLLYAEARTRVLSMASMAIVVGLVVAYLASRHVGRLEREIERQRLAERQNRRDLERLSARLVTAQEEERRSLSRELHDAVGQALTAIKMEMGVALRGVETDSRARASLDEARSIAESTLQSVRDLSQLLHPSMLDDFGLPEALAAHLRSFSKRSGIRAQFTHERMDERLSPEIEVCVYRIVQEALTNVARHSGASSCTVALIRRDGVLHLTIEDDGRGIDTAAARAVDARRGLGLIGMRERAQALSGTFVIENRPEGGTRVAVRLPVLASVDAPAGESQRLAG
ncbi:MAG: MCP four helix bundle domain-containing protein [Acidobacteria bacterium]|nr:MCP four helix bundle domain-containing protein [Acidobacteriota bacterium]